MTCCLAGLATIAMSNGNDLLRAVRLLGAVPPFLDGADDLVFGHHFDRTRHAAAIATVKTQVDPAAFETAWQEGQTMTVDQLIACAFEQTRQIA